MRTSTIKSIAALALTAVGSALVFGFRTSESVAVGTPALGDAGANTGRTAGSSSTSGSSGSAAAGYADGTWTGAAVSEPWGAFQIQVVIANGTIADATVVEAPTDRHSSQINSRAVPLLTQSALASQGASVDTVSGATWTSRSYAASLQSALDQAATA